MKYIDFKNNEWETRGLVYAYSHRFIPTPKFIQKDGYIESAINESMSDGYDWIGLITREKFSKSLNISTECYFNKYGAPLIVMANDAVPDKNGILRISDYIEIVIYENGVNVWKHTMENNKPTWKLIMGVEFEVPAGKKLKLSSYMKDDLLIIEAENKKMQVYLPDIPEKVHMGIIACEGINRFYNLQID